MSAGNHDYASNNRNESYNSSRGSGGGSRGQNSRGDNYCGRRADFDDGQNDGANASQDRDRDFEDFLAWREERNLFGRRAHRDDDNNDDGGNSHRRRRVMFGNRT